MSVPPEILDRQTSALKSRYTYSKLSWDSGEPVDRIVRRAPRSWLSRGCLPPFSSAAMYLALVPNTLMPSHRSHRGAFALGGEGRAVVEQQRGAAGQPLTSQFHIIQPQVVK
jgi:hypothetical protein